MPKASKPTSYNLVDSPKGYFSKREITKQDPNALVKGSKNIIINDADKWVTRKGYTLDGVAGDISQPIASSYDFISRNGKKILRSFLGATANTGKLQVRTEYEVGTPIWYDLLTSLTYSDFSYTTFWNATESIRELIFVDGTTSIRRWGGGVAYISSNTATTLTKTGTETWAQAGFYVSEAGRTVTIPGKGTFTYTGGENTTTLTGLTALPAIDAGTPAFQGVITITSLTGVSPAISPNVVMTKSNQVCYGSTLSSVIWGSKNTDYSDCQFTSPIRKPGEGFKITLDSQTVGFAQDGDKTYIFAGLDERYEVTFTLTADQSGESITFDKKVAAGQSAISQKGIIPVKNGVMYLTNEKTLTWLTSVQNVFTPQSLPTSDPIKDDFDSYNLTGATGVFFENALWLAIPAENLVYIYDFDRAFWQSPQTIPISSFSIIKNSVTQKNELYGHSNSKNETYKLNDGLSDNGVKIEFIAAFAYRSYGDRGAYKQYDEYLTEAYMSTVTDLKCTHRYEYLGSDIIVEKEINGDDEELIFSPVDDGNLGKEDLGKTPFGGVSETLSELNKYRCIHELQKIDFFEHQIVYSSDSEDAQFELLCHGPNVEMSSNLPRSIKR